MDTTAGPLTVVNLNDINDDDKVNDDDSSSENGDDDLICNRDGDSDSGDDICCETPVHVMYHFEAGHLERHMKNHPRFVHNATTGLSTCLACRGSIPNAKRRKSRCKLRDGNLVGSEHISFTLARHESETSQVDANKIWFNILQPQVNSNGCRQGPVILENAPRPVLDTGSINTDNSKLAAAHRARNSSRGPIAMAALYLGKNCRPGRDMYEVCALIQKPSN